MRNLKEYLMSETSKHRNLFLQYCKGNGLDIGFGGDPIVPTAICVDLPNRYSFVGQSPQHIACSADNLYMFTDNSLDYVYSSHCIEDFLDTKGVLTEWLRVIKPGGYLCLLFPDEQEYERKSKTSNDAHKYADFGIAFVGHVLNSMSTTVTCEFVKELFDGDDYNCALVLRKEG